MIYFYIFICISLLIFNVFYIVFSKEQKHRKEKKAKKYYEIIKDECIRLKSFPTFSQSHADKLVRDFQNMDILLAYHEAVEKSRAEDAQGTQNYLSTYSQSFYTLALKYAKRPAMERAFYAYLIANYHLHDVDNLKFGEVLLTYFENSTVFCRENVLQAIYNMGNIRYVVRAFLLLKENGWSHERHLIVDGLMKFTGDKENLVEELWKHMYDFDESLQVSIVQFATRVSGSFAPQFLKALKAQETPMEVRFAIIRYFGRWNYELAQDVLLDFISKEHMDQDELAIVAASALAIYPCMETRNALLQALYSRNYYVRYNAAMSLKKLKITDEEILTIYQSKDQYAIDMLDYILGRMKGVVL